MTDTTRVLVVDDVEMHRYVLASWLRRAGFAVVEAGTGEEALALVREGVDVVVLDVNLPDIEGPEVCARIKKDPVTALVPVMHVSATAIDVTARTFGLDSGADLYLVEPLEPEELVASVRALARSQRARRDAGARAGKLTRLNTVMLPLNAASSLPELVEAACNGAADVFRRPAMAAVEAEDGRVVWVLSAGPGTALLTEVSSTPVARRWPEPTVASAAEMAINGGPLIARAGICPDRWQVVTPGGQASFALAVALGPGATALDGDERVLFDGLSATLAVALENRRAYNEEHRIALMLQQALLPAKLPALEGLACAAHYLASNVKVSIGGDFYDAHPLADGRVAVVIGDVQGHSLPAARLMAELRFSLRAYLAEAHDAGAVLSLLNSLICRDHPDLTATVALLILSRDRRHAELANAGHLPPLVASAEGCTLLYGNSPPLGASSEPIVGRMVELPEQSALVLVTDGLIERRDQPIDRSLELLRETLAEAGTRSAQAIVELLLERYAERAPDDDVAILVVERLATGDHLSPDAEQPAAQGRDAGLIVPSPHAPGRHP